MIQRIVVFVSLLAAISASAIAQTSVTYRPFKVVDSAGNPISGATVETQGVPVEVLQTDNQGRLEKGLPIYGGDYATIGFRVSKPGYHAYEDIGLLSGPFSDH